MILKLPSHSNRERRGQSSLKNLNSILKHARQFDINGKTYYCGKTTTKSRGFILKRLDGRSFTFPGAYYRYGFQITVTKFIKMYGTPIHLYRTNNRIYRNNCPFKIPKNYDKLRYRYGAVDQKCLVVSMWID